MHRIKHIQRTKMAVELEDAEDQQVIMVVVVDVGQALHPELAQQGASITWE